jgi:hypothetical protein
LRSSTGWIKRSPPKTRLLTHAGIVRRLASRPDRTQAMRDDASRSWEGAP